MSALVGTWTLVKTTSVAADGTELAAPYGGEHAMGLVSLSADGRMVCVMCDSRDQVPDGKPREYNSYCGAYIYDGRQLKTQVDVSSNAAWLNTEQVRDVAFEGSTLVLRPPLRAYHGQPEQRTLYWQRLA